MEETTDVYSRATLKDTTPARLSCLTMFGRYGVFCSLSVSQGADKIYEQELDVIPRFRGSFNERTAEFACQSSTFLPRDFSVEFLVILVTDQHKDRILSRDTCHRLVKGFEAIKC